MVQTLLLHWGIALVVAAVISYLVKPIKAFNAGLIAMIFGIIITYGISKAVPTNNIEWALIAVGYASMFAGLSGYLSGIKDVKTKT